MNKQEIVNFLYPNNKELFSYDTALPMHFMKDILETVFPKLDPFMPEYSEKYIAVYNSVYAYGKGKDRSSGLIPLTYEAKEILNAYERKAGYSPIFTPTISPYIESKEKQFKNEFEEIGKNIYQSESEYIENRFKSRITFSELKELINQ